MLKFLIQLKLELEIKREWWIKLCWTSIYVKSLPSHADQFLHWNHSFPRCVWHALIQKQYCLILRALNDSYETNRCNYTFDIEKSTWFLAKGGITSTTVLINWYIALDIFIPNTLNSRMVVVMFGLMKTIWKPTLKNMVFEFTMKSEFLNHFSSISILCYIHWTFATNK